MTEYEELINKPLTEQYVTRINLEQLTHDYYSKCSPDLELWLNKEWMRLTRWAFASGDLKTASWLIEQEFSYSISTELEILLKEAISHNMLRIVKLLTKRGEGVIFFSQVFWERNGAIMHAISLNRLECVHEMITTRKRRTEKYFFPVLLCCILENNVRALNCVMDAAEVTDKDIVEECMRSHKRICYDPNSHVDMYEFDKQDTTPLLLALARSNFETIRLLLLRYHSEEVGEYCEDAKPDVILAICSNPNLSKRNMELDWLLGFMEVTREDVVDEHVLDRLYAVCGMATFVFMHWRYKFTKEDILQNKMEVVRNALRMHTDENCIYFIRWLIATFGLYYEHFDDSSITLDAPTAIENYFNEYVPYKNCCTTIVVASPSSPVLRLSSST